MGNQTEIPPEQDDEYSLGEIVASNSFADILRSAARLRDDLKRTRPSGKESQADLAMRVVLGELAFGRVCEVAAGQFAAHSEGEFVAFKEMGAEEGRQRYVQELYDTIVLDLQRNEGALIDAAVNNLIDDGISGHFAEPLTAYGAAQTQLQQIGPMITGFFNAIARGHFFVPVERPDLDTSEAAEQLRSLFTGIATDMALQVAGKKPADVLAQAMITTYLATTSDAIDMVLYLTDTTGMPTQLSGAILTELGLPQVPPFGMANWHEQQLEQPETLAARQVHELNIACFNIAGALVTGPLRGQVEQQYAEMRFADQKTGRSIRRPDDDAFEKAHNRIMPMAAGVLSEAYKLGNSLDGWANGDIVRVDVVACSPDTHKAPPLLH